MASETAWNTLDGKAPLVIAHRGASGYLPEHTLAAYQLAIEHGADYIEPDLVATRDGHLIARHEPLLDDTTDIATRPEFSKRKTTREMDGREVSGYFASDFTLEEIRKLRAVQPNPARSKEHDGRHGVPTFDEILELLVRESAARGRRIGIYPETKHPAFHLALGLPLEERLLAALRRHGLDRADAPVYIQSFESANLQHLRTRTRVRLVQLLDVASVELDSTGRRVTGVKVPSFGDPRGDARPRALADVVRYADAIGPSKRSIMREDTRGALVATDLIEQAHAAGLTVHAYTFRSEPATLAPGYRGDPRLEYREFYALGLDGVFTDFPDVALAVRAQLADDR